ncbi:hypothetical protein OG259_07665 [Streptomyces sp. NBC_00250]|uniref:hypothetical protein n=1 Tax=Streptomyces sp. NBC_00250 TaxID=2903641 RepID=UPI002E27ADB7|nr:hypothetical protein [Streptomyces sp. NBC_00250]
MPLKPHYLPTRADAADLARDAQPGDRLYAINGEYIVTADTSPVFGSHLVRPADSAPGPGSITLAQLLAHCGGIFTQPLNHA